MTIIFGVFIYGNKLTGWIYIAYIVIAIINIYFIMLMIKIIIKEFYNKYYNKFVEIIDKIGQKIVLKF